MSKSTKQSSEAARFRQDIRSQLRTRVREAIEIVLEEELKAQGTTAGLMDDMVSLEDCFNLVGLSEMLSIDAGYLSSGDPASGDPSDK